MLKVNLGCGLTTPPGWINVDGSWNARLARWPAARGLLRKAGLIPAASAAVPWRDVLYHDLRRPLPWDDGAIDTIYASHLLEHLYRDHAAALLRECHRVLRREGVLRLMVPDLEDLARRYLAARDAPEKATPAAGDVFMANSHLRSATAPAGPLPFRLYRLLMDLETHKWMYDAESLPALVESIGFADVGVATRHVSREPDIAAVETNHGLIVEAVKP
jgi:SAM-dependent methyltransferase